MGPIEAIERCRDIFKGGCRSALDRAHAGLSVDEGMDIVRACAATYCPLPQPTLLCNRPLSLADATHGMQSFVRFGLTDVAGSNEYDRAEVGVLLGKELLPVRPVWAYATIGEHGVVTLAIDGGDSWRIPAHPAPEDAMAFAYAVAKAGGDAGGVDLRGIELADKEVRDAVGIALGRVLVLDQHFH